MRSCVAQNDKKMPPPAHLPNPNLLCCQPVAGGVLLSARDVHFCGCVGSCWMHRQVSIHKRPYRWPACHFPSVRPSTRPSVRLSVCLYVRPPIRPVLVCVGGPTCRRVGRQTRQCIEVHFGVGSSQLPNCPSSSQSDPIFPGNTLPY